MRKYSAVQIVGFILSLFLPPVAVWFTEGLGIDFWINVILCFLGFIPGSIHACYIWIVWIERKWQTHHGETVTNHPFLIFSTEFEERSRWKGNGQDGFFGYFDDNIKGGTGLANTVGGDVDPERAQPAPMQHPVQHQQPMATQASVAPVAPVAPVVPAAPAAPAVAPTTATY